MIISFIGPEGSGKGTQAALIAEKLHVPHIIMGRLIDAFMEDASPLGEKIREVRSTGQYLPDEMVSEILFKRLNEADCANGFVLDGVPRSIDQAKVIQTFLREQGKQMDVAFYLQISEAESLKRLIARGRFDDTPENIKGRLANFHQRVDPLIVFYKDQGILQEVNGERSVEEIHNDIMGRVSKA